MLMSMQHCVSPRPTPPPPLAPKPNKDNARLQKILKRIAKRQVAEISLQPEDASDKPHSYPSKPFRACLSPVSEASPDPEQCERRTRSPQSPTAPLPPLRKHLTTVTPTHGLSLYPIRKTFYKGKIEILPKTQTSGPQTPAEPQKQVPGQLLQPMVPVKTFFISTAQPGSKKQQSPMLAIPPRFSPSIYTQPGTEITSANISKVESIKPTGPVPETHITKLYEANGPDVAVTGATGYVFGTNRAETPTYESPRTKTPTYEPPRWETPTYEPPRMKTPTYEPPRMKTPSYEPPRVKTPTYEPPRVKTPTYEPPRVKTPTYEPPRVKTPTYEPPRVKTPTYEPPKVKTPSYEPPRVKTPSYEPPRWETPSYEPPRTKTPTYEPPRTKTPTYEPPRTKTPTYEPQRVKTPNFEIPRENTFTHDVPQDSFTKRASDVSVMQNDALTLGTASANVEIHHIAMTTMEKNEVETEPRPSNSVAETSNQEDVKSFPKAAPQLKSTERIKPPRSKISGWTRLKKHMVVEEEPPKFPEPEPEPELPESEAQKQNQSKAEDGKQESQKAKGSRANKMWDAMLYQMFAWKEKLTEASRPDQQEPDLEKSGQTQQKTWFSCRLPLLLFRPRFDARKLKEAAKGPLKRISSTLIESGLHRKAIDDEELKDFNRTAKGWQTKAAA